MADSRTLTRNQPFHHNVQNSIANLIGMIILLSPSKTLDFESDHNIPFGSYPIFIKESEKLIKILRKLRVQDIASLMKISYKLASINVDRYHEWKFPYEEKKSKPAVAAFKGDVYQGLKVWELNTQQLLKVDDTVRIISGLYGILNPSDQILPYRLEMGIQLKGNNFNNLYEFWGEKLTKHLRKDLKEKGKKILVNLASAEYFKAIDINNLKVETITPFFQELSNGTYKFISVNGKKARGLMVRYIIDNEIDDFNDLKGFNYEGYSFNSQKSDKKRWVFTREHFEY